MVTVKALKMLSSPRSVSNMKMYDHLLFLSSMIELLNLSMMDGRTSRRTLTIMTSGSITFVWKRALDSWSVLERCTSVPSPMFHP